MFPLLTQIRGRSITNTNGKSKRHRPGMAPFARLAISFGFHVKPIDSLCCHHELPSVLCQSFFDTGFATKGVTHLLLPTLVVHLHLLDKLVSIHSFPISRSFKHYLLPKSG